MNMMKKELFQIMDYPLLNVDNTKEIVYLTLFSVGLLVLLSAELMPKLKTSIILLPNQYILNILLTTVIMSALIFVLYMSGINTWTGSNPWDPMIIDENIGGLAESSTSRLTTGGTSTEKIIVDLKIKMAKGGEVYLYDHLHPKGETINTLYPNDTLVRFESSADRGRGRHVARLYDGIKLPDDIVKDKQIKATGYWVQSSFKEDYNITSNGRSILVSEDRSKFFVIWRPWPSFKG